MLDLFNLHILEPDVIYNYWSLGLQTVYVTITGLIFGAFMYVGK